MMLLVRASTSASPYTLNRTPDSPELDIEVTLVDLEVLPVLEGGLMLVGVQVPLDPGGL